MALMSIYSLWVMVERYIVFQKAKNQSLKLLGALSNLLTKGDYAQAIEVTKKYKQQPPGEGHRRRSARVRGFAPRQAHHRSRARRRSRAPGHGPHGHDHRRRAEGEPRRSRDHRRHRAVRRSVRNGHRHHQRLRPAWPSRGGGIASVSAGIAEALFTTAGGLLVAIPAVWAYNYFQNRVDRFTVEMSNSGSEMAIYFMKEVGVGDEKAVG